MKVTFYEAVNIDCLLKSQEITSCVIPAKAGIQAEQELPDPGDPVPAKAGSRGDGLGRLLLTITSCVEKELDRF